MGMKPDSELFAELTDAESPEEARHMVDSFGVWEKHGWREAYETLRDYAEGGCGMKG